MVLLSPTSASTSEPSFSMSDYWREIPGWEGFYAVSYRGEVRSMTRRVTRSDGFEQFIPGQSKRIHFDKDGYARTNLRRPGCSVTAQVHVLVCEAFHGQKPPDSEVCHANDIRSDNRADNLSWGTRQSNAAEMAQRNRVKGERHPRAKITPFQAFMIQTAPHTRGNGPALAKALGVNHCVISGIWQGRNWSWL